MSGLDDKLIGILWAIPEDSTKIVAIAQIKQAFADEGYKDMSSYFNQVLSDISDYAKKKATGSMTGQEWLTRFAKELQPRATAGKLDEWLKRDDIEEAAKRAAGLE